LSKGRAIADKHCSRCHVIRDRNKFVRPEGINLLQANGPGAKQSVFHLHIQIFPRYAADGGGMKREMVPGNVGHIGRLAKEIKAGVK